MKRIFTLSVLLSCLLFAGCTLTGGDDRDKMVGPCPGPEIVDFAEYYIPWRLNFPGLEGETLYRITSQEQFNDIIGDFEGKKDIDFGKYELLFVQGGAANGIKEIHKYLYKEGTRYYVSIYLEMLITTEAPPWNAAMLVKGMKDIEIDLQVDYSDRS